MNLRTFSQMVLLSALLSSVALAQVAPRPHVDLDSRFARDCKKAEPFDTDPIAPDGTVTKPRDLLALEESHRNKPRNVVLKADLAEMTYLFGVRLMLSLIHIFQRPCY